MKRTLVISSVIIGLLGSLWLGFSLGVYYQARLASAFTANQILIVRQMLVRQEDPQTIIKKAADLADRWEAHIHKGMLLSAFNPKNIPNLVGLSGETHLLQTNHEIMRTPLPTPDHP